LQKNDFISSLRSSIVAIVVLLLVFAFAQQPFSLLQQQEEAIAHQ
jgi:hypothetical protein